MSIEHLEPAGQSLGPHDPALSTQDPTLRLRPAGLSTQHSALRTTWRLVTFSRTGALGAAILLVFCLLAIGAPWIAPADPVFQDLPNRSKFVSPQHLLGTD